MSYAFSRKGGSVSRNCLLSTIYTPKQILKQFPAVRILLAENDPMRDNGIKLGLNLKKAGADVEILYFQEYLHNFNQMDNPTLCIGEYLNAYNHTI